MKALRSRSKLRIIALLAFVPAINGADQTVVGTVAPLLEKAFRVSHAQIGLLLTSSGIVAALAVLPVGLLSDRTCRTRLVWIAMAVWGLTMLAGGAAQGYLWLLLSRLALGAASATVGPTLASLIGDFFPAHQRARIYGYILTGDLIGAGFGLLIAGNLAALLSWRWAFWALALPSPVMAWLIWKWLPEPARGKQSRGKRDRAGSGAARVVRKTGAPPRRSLVLHRDPVSMPFARAALYVLRVPTNRFLIVASALGYFFFAGVRAFAVLYFRDRFGLSESQAILLLAAIGIGALGGVFAAGPFADGLLKRGYVNARIVVPAVAYLLAALVFIPAFLSATLWMAAPLFFVSAAALAAPNPPADAARLDIMHFRLWGRAESVRTFIRTLLESFAPLLFGVLADFLGGTVARTAGGLTGAFLIMLIPLMLAGVLMLQGRRTYAPDVQTAIASEEEPFNDLILGA